MPLTVKQEYIVPIRLTGLWDFLIINWKKNMKILTIFYAKCLHFNFHCHDALATSVVFNANMTKQKPESELHAVHEKINIKRLKALLLMFK